MTRHSISRRNLLALAGTTGIGLVLPAAGNAAAVATAPVAGGIDAPFTGSRRPVLLLITLQGGNDGLNTVVPRADADYRRCRPTLALTADEVLPLDASLGLHPALRPLMPAWDAGNLRLLLGVGHGDPVMSHHRALAQWDAAADGGGEGWIARAITASGGSPYGLSFGSAAGALQSPRVITVPVSDRGADHGFTITTACDHAERIRSACEVVERARTCAPTLAAFPGTSIGQRLADCARLIAAGIVPPAMVISHEGYDTHHQQRATHDRLLAELGDALAAFRSAVSLLGRWDDMLVMVQSEFGRNVVENAHGGTDHGGSGPVLLIGGRVAGGFSGRQPTVDGILSGQDGVSTTVAAVKDAVAAEWIAPTTRTAASGILKARPLSQRLGMLSLG
jgi:uncharacterized protein (DUF1501 family)